MTKTDAIKLLIIFQTTIGLINSSHANGTGIIPRQQMQAFCDGSAKSFMNELENINRSKIESVKGLTQHVEDSKNVDEIIRQFIQIQNKYLESIEEIDRKYGQSSTNTANLRAKINNLDDGYMKTPKLFNLNDITTTATELNAANDSIYSLTYTPHENHRLKSIVSAFGESASYPHSKVPSTSWLNGINNILGDSEKLRCLKALNENVASIPADLRPDVIISLYSNKAPRTVALLNTLNNNEISELYACLDKPIAPKDCDKFIASSETFIDLKVKLINEEYELGKEISSRTSSVGFKRLIGEAKKNQLKKETLQDSINLIKEQLGNEKNLHKDASFGALETKRKSFEDYTIAEKRLKTLQDEISGESSLFFILFDDKRFANPESFENDYIFQKEVLDQVQLTKEVEQKFLSLCINSEITNDTQSVCLNLLGKSVGKIQALKDNFITRNKNQIQSIRDTMTDPAFNAIENLKKLFVHTYMNNCRSESVTSKDVLITCEAKDNDHTVIKNLFNNTYNVIGKLNDSLASTNTITPEVREVFRDACSWINDDVAPVLNRDLCSYFKKDGEFDQKQNKTQQHKIMAMNKAEFEARDNYIQYDANSRNQLKKTPKQSWGTIIGRGIIPVIPYAINNGMGLYQNKMQTESLLNTGLMQKQFLHNLNYSWKYPINSYNNNPFLYGTNNGQLHSFPNFGANSLTPTPGIGITNGFNFGN